MFYIFFEETLRINNLSLINLVLLYTYCDSFTDKINWPKYIATY